MNALLILLVIFGILLIVALHLVLSRIVGLRNEGLLNGHSVGQFVGATPRKHSMP